MSTTIRGLEDVHKLQGLLSEHHVCIENISDLDHSHLEIFSVVAEGFKSFCQITHEEFRLVLETRYKANSTKLANHGINVKPYETPLSVSEEV